MKPTKNTIRFLLHNQVLVALPVAFYTLATFQLLKTPTLIKVPVFVYLATYALYNFHRIYGVFMGNPADYEKRHWYTVQHFEIQILFTMIALLLAALIATSFTVPTLLVLLIASVIAFLYSVKFKIRNTIIRIRDIPFIKVFVIAVVVAAISVFIPFLEGPKSLHSNLIWWYYLEHFLFIVSITIPFDARDVALDSKYKLLTIPVYFGKNKSALITSLFYAAFCMLFFLLNGFSPIAFALFFGLFICINSSILFKLPDWFYTIVIEGAMFIYYIVILNL